MLAITFKRKFNFTGNLSKHTFFFQIITFDVKFVPLAETKFTMEYNMSLKSTHNKSVKSTLCFSSIILAG